MNAERSLGAVISDLLTEFTQLFRTEVRLARVELSENVGKMGVAIGFTAAGGFILFAGFLFVLAAAVGGLIEAGLPLWLSALIIGGLTLAVGVILLWLGLRRLKAKELTPKRTVHQLERDAAVVRYQVQTP
ncbi:MAG TPA: phage holin family protein [Rhizomicrobium sp.]|jgi:hypothetical protein|nr:phage holin family protein [Rhizomicrobium sp.]